MDVKVKDLTNVNKRAKPPLNSCIRINTGNLPFPDQSS